MNKILSVLVAATVLSVAAVGSAHAAASENLTITVTVSPNVSIELADIGGSPISTLALGTVGVGGSVTASAPIVVKNNGSGVGERITISHTSSGAWSSGATAEDETYVLSADFVDDVASASWTQVDSVQPVYVDHNDSAKVWFKFDAPTSTRVSSQQSLNVIINAEAEGSKHTM